VVQAIEAADAALGKLISGLKERDVFEAIDIILVYAPLLSTCLRRVVKSYKLFALTTTFHSLPGPTMV
jgi:hypothetical protein